MQGLVILGSLVTNRDPLKRVQVFEPVPAAFQTLEQAIQAAKDHYWLNFAQGRVPQFRVYQSSDPDGTTYALVEVSDASADMVFLALYKIIAGKYRWAEGPAAAPHPTISGTVGMGAATAPPASGVQTPERRFRG